MQVIDMTARGQKRFVAQVVVEVAAADLSQALGQLSRLGKDYTIRAVQGVQEVQS